MNVDEATGCGWGGWGDNVHGKCTPSILARELDAGNGSKNELCPSFDPIPLLLGLQVEGKTLIGQQRHIRKGTPPLNDVWSSASVTRKASRTFELSRIEERTSDVTSWRKRMSGRLAFSRIPPRMSLARATGREEKASKFHVMRERSGTRASCCDTWLGAYLEDTGSQSRADDLNAERVRWHNLLAAHGWT